MGRVFVCGDTHGWEHDTKKLGSKMWKEQKELTKEDVVVQLGDFGWVWHEFGENAEQEYWLDVLAKKRFTLAVVPGNHENYDIINRLPQTFRWGNVVKVLERKGGEIYFLERGRAYEINGKKILAIGGAKSIDKHARVEGISWWPQELLSKTEEDMCLDEIEKHKRKFDYILTHTPPANVLQHFIPEGMMQYNIKQDCPVAKFLSYVDSIVEFKEWHCGHMHVDDVYENGDIYYCHYNNLPMELK